MSSENNNWGYYYWAMFHKYSFTYPINPSPTVKIVAKEFIKSIPFLIPCSNPCADHAYLFISSRFFQMDSIVSSRFSISTFFVDFHNYVNINLGKQPMSYENAKKLWE